MRQGAAEACSTRTITDSLRLMEEVTVGTYLRRGEAEIVRARLAAEGIDARVVADDEGGLNPGFFAEYAVRLVVLAPDREAALAVLDPDAQP